MDDSAAITTSVGVPTQPDFEAYKKAVHQVSVCQSTNIKIEADLYIAPLDVLRRTRLDSDWGMGGLALKVDITPWFLMPYEYMCSRILDIVRSNNSSTGEDLVLHRTFYSNAEVHRLGFLFENTKRHDKALIVFGREIQETNVDKQAVDHCTAAALRAAHGSHQKFFSSLSKENDSVIYTGSYIVDVSGVEVHGISVDGTNYSVLPGSQQRLPLGLDNPDEVKEDLSKTLQAQTLADPCT